MKLHQYLELIIGGIPFMAFIYGLDSAPDRAARRRQPKHGRHR